MSSTIDLDFQDYTPTNSGTTAGSPKSQQPGVQILIPPKNSPAGSTMDIRANQGGPKSVLQNVANFGAESGGLSEETLRQLIWLSNRQKSKQQRESKIQGGNWGLGLLAKYFDVTTDDVIQRIIWSFIPIRKEGFDIDEFQDSDLTQPLTSATDDSQLSETFSDRRKRLSYMERFIQSRPDFYGPFWISTTLIFAIAIFSNIISSIKFQSKLEEINHIRESLMSTNETKEASSLVSVLNQEDSWHYSMSELNTAASLITFYVTLWPSFLWFLFWLRGCAKYYTLTETICAYGYSLSIFIPMSALLVVQASAFRYLIISIAAALSGSVLVLSFLPLVHGASPSSGGSHFIVLIAVFGCQFLLAYTLHRILLQ